MKNLREAIVEAIETLTEALAGVEDETETEESEDGMQAEAPETEADEVEPVPRPAVVAALRGR